MRGILPSTSATVYSSFGYPLAHEDDAQRAVRAGLGIIEALGQLNTRLAQEGLCRADVEWAATRCAPPAPTQSRQGSATQVMLLFS
jgi:hypothetical protein